MLTLPASSILTLADDVYLGLLIYYLRTKGFNVLLSINSEGPYSGVCECFRFWLPLYFFSRTEDFKRFGNLVHVLQNNRHHLEHVIYVCVSKKRFNCTLQTMATHAHSINHELFTE